MKKMNEPKMENKNAGLKYALFIAIPVILILTALGVYYYLTNPEKVLKNTIDNSIKWAENVIKSTQKQTTYNLENDPAIIKGTLSFKTDYDLNGLEELQNYTYDYETGWNLSEKDFYTTLRMKDTQEIISLSSYILHSKVYLKLNDIYSHLIALPSENVELPSITTQDSEFTWNITQEDILYLIENSKKYLIESIDKKYLSREKTNINMENEEIKTTKITYNLNQENEKRTLEFIKSKIINDNRYVDILARLTNQTIEDIKKQFEDKEIDVTNIKEGNLIIYTEGLKQKVIRMDYESENITSISYTNYKDEKRINFQNDVSLKIKEFTDDVIDIDYQISEVTGNVRIQKLETENEKSIFNNKIHVDFTIDNQTTEIDMTIEMTKEDFNKPDEKDAVNINEITGEELIEILTNLEEKLEKTPLWNIFENQLL